MGLARPVQDKRIRLHQMCLLGSYSKLFGQLGGMMTVARPSLGNSKAAFKS